jgi:hypothetical protein
MAKRQKVFLIGVGDLGSRLSQLIAESRLATDLRLAGRGSYPREWANVLSLATDCRVTSTRVDAMDQNDIKDELGSFEPDLILQCASLLSPWAFSRSLSTLAKAVVRSGFALQVSAQLPIIWTLMQAHRALALSCAVVNCSFPDLTHPMLGALDLSPTVGIGNVALIAARVSRFIRSSSSRSVRVIAHHSQVSRCMSKGTPDSSFLRPLVYYGQKPFDSSGWLGHSSLSSEGGGPLNQLSASTAMPLVGALLNKESRVRTHAPGVSGLPGGYPIEIIGGRIALDLPNELSAVEAIAFNNKAARLDGIDRITADGTLIYTTEVCERFETLCRELCEPLRIDQCFDRWNILKRLYDEAY